MKMHIIIHLLLFEILLTIHIRFALASNSPQSSPTCFPRIYGENKIVCVCNKDKCYALPSTKLEGIVDVYETNKQGLRFKKTSFNHFPLSNESVANSVLLIINHTEEYQKINGFGAAFTDSATINTITNNFTQEIINDYFGENGLKYSLIRIPIGGTDFSTHPYTYDDVDYDFNMTFWKLATEDISFKIPCIKEALKHNQNLRLLGSAWSSPPWTKFLNTISGFSHLKGEPEGKYYKYWAKYYIKFLDAYKEQGLKFWGLTAANEPVLFNYFNGIHFSKSNYHNFIKYDLGPELYKNGYNKSNLKLLVLDDGLPFSDYYLSSLLSDNEAAKYISGIAFHYYYNFLDNVYQIPVIMSKKFPGYFWLSTEACEGTVFRGVSLGNWERGESYGKDIIKGLNHLSTGWIDWNFALDPNGGPSWAKNYVDAPIIINQTEYYKQPTFYFLGHFSKFLPINSIRIGHQMFGNVSKVYITTFKTDEYLIVIAMNKNNYEVNLNIKDAFEIDVSFTLTPSSIQTFKGKLKM